MRAAFAATPRDDAASDDAARDAALRFDADVDVAARVALLAPEAAVFFAAVDFFAGVVVVAGPSFSGIDAASAADAPSAVAPSETVAGSVDAVGAGEFAAPAFAADDRAVVARGARGFGAADVASSPPASPETAAVVAALDFRAGRLPPRAFEAAASPRSADVSMPVPSGVSSSAADRETEVTTPTYQRPPRKHSWHTQG